MCGRRARYWILPARQREPFRRGGRGCSIREENILDLRASAGTFNLGETEPKNLRLKIVGILSFYTLGFR